jgi:transcriptional regulator with XRE-family HTH domain
MNWTAPAPNKAHEWLYRGQVTPDKRETTLSLAAREADPARRLLTVDGLMMVDGLPIYKMEGFTIGLNPGPVRRKVADPPGPARAAPPAASDITGGMILDWRKANNLSQGQLARLMGVTPIYISLMERGRRNISRLMAEKLRALFQAAPPFGQGGPLQAGAAPKSRPESRAAALGLLTPEDLRARRLALGLSQRKLAEAVGVTASLIGLIELGKRGLGLELARKILAALKE